MSPSFFCIGVPKSATTSLHAQLVSDGIIDEGKYKEPHYLVYTDKSEFINSYKGTYSKMDTWCQSKEEYLQLFTSTIPDFSTHYFHHIKKFYNNGISLFGQEFATSRIVLILRHPVERAFSHYNMKVRDGVENLDFMDAILPATIEERMKKGYQPSFDYIGFSRYKENYIFLQEHFENVLVIDYAEYSSNFKETYKKITEFIGAKPIDTPAKLERLNAGGTIKGNPLTKALHKFTFGANPLKKLIPNSIKDKYKAKTLSKVGNFTMERATRNIDEEQLATELLQDEIEFYEQLFPKHE